MICNICNLEPGSHSLRKISEKNNTTIYYACPAEASKYYDCSGIIHHYDNELQTITTEKWIWVMDCNGFDMKHLMQAQVGIGLGELISKKYSENLEKIYVINPNWYIYSMTSIVWPFIGKKVRSRIVYDTNKYITNIENLDIIQKIELNE